jgi:pre-mRNA-splicing factor SYF2
VIIADVDYTQHAEKGYRQDVRGLKPNMEEYKKARDDALAKGQLVETEDGELAAVDEDGRFYANANSLGITDHKPTKEALDRLAEETKRRCHIVPSPLTVREAERETKRRKKREGDGGDVSYINKRNKVFNEKLSRYYDQYTREIKEAFERGSGV